LPFTDAQTLQTAKLQRERMQIRQRRSYSAIARWKILRLCIEIMKKATRN